MTDTVDSLAAAAATLSAADRRRLAAKLAEKPTRADVKAMTAQQIAERLQADPQAFDSIEEAAE
jgi:hypothetical protein